MQNMICNKIVFQQMIQNWRFESFFFASNCNFFTKLTT